MSHFTLFVALWLMTLLAAEHLLANRGIVLGENLPLTAAWFLRIAYVGGTGGVAFLFLLLAAEMALAP
jgi:hypothetical protein